VKLHAPFIQLPLVFDAAVLAAEIAALGEGPWRPHPQGFPGNSMLPLLAVDGDPRNESFAGTMRPTPELLACPYLTQTIASLGATAGRSRLMRLSGHAEVTRHADQGYYWAERVRVHVPVVTQPTVRFECGGTTLNMAAGECWIFDTWRQHSVLNDAVQSRIHLVVDTVGGGRFWDLVGQGRIPAFDGGGANEGNADAARADGQGGTAPGRPPPAGQPPRGPRGARRRAGARPGRAGGCGEGVRPATGRACGPSTATPPKAAPTSAPPCRPSSPRPATPARACCWPTSCNGSAP